MIRTTPESTRTETRFPYTTRFRSNFSGSVARHAGGNRVGFRSVLWGCRHERRPPVQHRATLFAECCTPPAGCPRLPLCPVQCPCATLWNIFREMLRSEEHTSELQSLMRISYAVFCFKKKL